MRNADQDRSRRTRAALRIAGLAPLIGAGALLASCQAAEPAPSAGKPATQQVSEAKPAVPDVGKVQSVPQGAAAGQVGPAAPGAADPTGTKSTAERLADARSANERLGTTVRREAPKPVTNVDPSKVRTVEKGSLKDDKRMMRIVSSKQDLTGYRELGWIADEGQSFGDARCSRTVSMSGKPPSAKPTLLMCWRTTPAKSVYTITVDLKKKPTAKDGVAALDKEWARMSR